MFGLVTTSGRPLYTPSLGKILASLIAIVILLIGASYLLQTTHTPTFLSNPAHSLSVQMTATCFPLGNTGSVTAKNTGTETMQLTALVIFDSNGNIVNAVQLTNGVWLTPGSSAPLSSGLAYPGTSATIEAFTANHNGFVTACPFFATTTTYY